MTETNIHPPAVLTQPQPATASPHRPPSLPLPHWVGGTLLLGAAVGAYFFSLSNQAMSIKLYYLIGTPFFVVALSLVVAGLSLTALRWNAEKHGGAGGFVYQFGKVTVYITLGLVVHALSSHNQPVGVPNNSTDDVRFEGLAPGFGWLIFAAVIVTIVGAILVSLGQSQETVLLKAALGIR